MDAKSRIRSSDADYAERVFTRLLGRRVNVPGALHVYVSIRAACAYDADGAMLAANCCVREPAEPSPALSFCDLRRDRTESVDARFTRLQGGCGPEGDLSRAIRAAYEQLRDMQYRDGSPAPN